MLNIRLSSLGLFVLALILAAGCSRDGKLARHTSRGDDYVRKEQYAKAEVEYLNALRLAPKDHHIVRKLANVFFAQGRTVAASSALKEVVQADPNDFDSRLKLGILLGSMSEMANAREQALFVAQQQPTNSLALLLLAETSLNRTQSLQAQKVLTEASKSALPYGSSIALAALSQQEGNFSAAEQILKNATAQNPPAPEIDLAWAKLRLLQTNFVEAEVLIKRAAMASPVRSRTRIQHIDFLISRGDFDTARKNIEEITSKAPDYVPAWLRLANIAFMEGQYADCDKFTQKVLTFDNRHHEALLLRARLWTVQRDFEKALTELHRLEASFPDNAFVKTELAAAQLRAGENAKATALLNDALRLDPRFVPAILLQAQLNIASGNPAAATTALTHLLKVRPEVREAAVLLGSALMRLGRHDDAIKVYREIAARYPRDPQAHTALGVALLTTKRDAGGARSALEQAHKLAPRYFPPLEHLVRLDIQARDYKAALSRATAYTSTATNSAAGFLLQSLVHSAAQDINAAEAALLKGLEREPNSLLVLGALADLYVRTHNHDKAIQRLDEFIGGSTNAFGAWTQKGIVLEAKGQKDKAIECYERALAINKNEPIALNNLAYLVSQSPKRLAEAFTLASRAREVAPTNASIADTLGWIQYQRRDFIAARQLLIESADTLANGEVQYHAAMACYAVGDEDGARRRFQQALADQTLPAAARETSASRLIILQMNPAQPAAGDLEKLTAAAKQNPDDYLVQFRLGSMFSTAGRKSEAGKAFESASKANPQSAQPLLALARIHASADHERAIEYARKARKLAPNDPSVAATLGSLSLRLHDYQAASGLLLEAQRGGAITQPRDRFDLAVAQFSIGRVAEAASTLQALAGQATGPVQQSATEALTLITGTPAQKAKLAQTRLQADSRDLLALVASAEAQEQADPRQAVTLYTRALAAAPQFSPAHQRLAILYLDGLNDEKLASTHALKARETSPSDPHAARVLGKIALKRGNFSEALRFAQEATTLGDGEPYYMLGLANFGLKRTNDAKIALAKAATLPLRPAAAADTKRLLAEIK